MVRGSVSRACGLASLPRGQGSDGSHLCLDGDGGCCGGWADGGWADGGASSDWAATAAWGVRMSGSGVTSTGAAGSWPDDIVELHSDLRSANDHPYERARAGQARPNVLFELGLALMAYPERTVVVDAGQMRPIADLAGLNTIRFDGSAAAIRKVVTRLEQAGCELDDSGTDWLDPERFAGLTAYQRGPATHRADQ